MDYRVKTALRTSDGVVEPDSIVSLDEAEAAPLLEIKAITPVAEPEETGDEKGKKPAAKKAPAK